MIQLPESALPSACAASGLSPTLVSSQFSQGLSCPSLPLLFLSF